MIRLRVGRCAATRSAFVTPKRDCGAVIHRIERRLRAETDDGSIPPLINAVFPAKADEKELADDQRWQGRLRLGPWFCLRRG